MNLRQGGAPNGRGERLLSRRNVIWLSLLLAYAVGGWMVLLHHVEGGHERGEPALVLHWLRDASLALPLFMATVWLAATIADRFLGIDGSHKSTIAAKGVLVGLFAAGAMALGNPLHQLLFDSSEAHALALPVHLARDFLAGVPVALLVAVPAVMVLTRTRTRSPLRGRIAAASVGVSLLASSLGVLAPSAAAQTAPNSQAPCPDGAPVRNYDVSAIDVDIKINRFGDHDPLGKMYVLTNRIADVRAAEASGNVTIGQRDDVIQPLAIRANLGDCVEIRFTNRATGGEYGLHIDGLVYNVDSSGDEVGANPGSAVARNQTANYRFYVPEDPTIEGSHYMHPGPGNRDAVHHGLFGALIAEPPGSVYLHPERDQQIESGWEARIVPGTGDRSFREYSLMLHEFGDEDYRLTDAAGGDVPVVDPITDSYRPGTRAINYRSEPFMRRLERKPNGEAQGYGTYMFGDPSTPIPRAYLGDPTKIRLMHGGGEVFHVFHLHGGGDRWRQNPHADPTWNYQQTGLDKQPQTQHSPSARLDSQSMGPGEAFDLQIEGGAGGVQQAAGDFLWHCHIAEHYIGGMWSFWRVYNTLQPDLAPLPDGPPPEVGVDSTELLGLQMPDGTVLNQNNIDDWIRPQLPPQGVTNGDEDAQVWDWRVDNASGLPLYLGEPETDQSDNFPNLIEGVEGHKGSYPGDDFVGARPVIKFDPRTGRPAWPLLIPHIGKRPPFSPDEHGGAPYLGETGDLDPSAGADPWASRADGICPRGAKVRNYNVVGVNMPIQVSDDVSDPNGKIYVLADDKNEFLNGTKLPEPLAVRANIGDCVAITLVSEIPDSADFGHFSKLNMHIHHVQFDVQASDGVISGAAFEQSVRPYTATDPTLTSAASAGDSVISLSDVAKFHEGTGIAVGMGTNGIEIRTIQSIDNGANTITLDRPLERNHGAGQFAGVEFVQYRWYPDVALDNVFWHDHTDGLRNWGHGLVGQLLVEPPGSTYHDPRTGEETNGAGAIADIRTNNPAMPGLVDGSFREMAIWPVADNPATGAAFNLRAEPWSERLDDNGDPSLLFSSYTHGDPRTPLPRAYVGDPFIVRAISAGPSLDSFHLDGHRFFYENRYSEGGETAATPISTARIGVSERFSFALEGGAGGQQGEPGDYMYSNTIGRYARQGAWGLMRVLPGLTETGPDALQPLPGNPVSTSGGSLPAGGTGQRPPDEAGAGDPCPAEASERTFNVRAIDLVGGDGRQAAFVEDSQTGAPGSEPLVMHVAQGDCVTVNFTNQRSVRSSFHVSELVGDPASSGVNAGFNAEQTVAPGGSRTYRYYADNWKIGIAPVSDFGGDETDPLGPAVNLDPALDGMYGAMVVARPGAEFFHPGTGQPTAVGAQVDVHLPDGTGYRDFSLLLADQDPRIGDDEMPYPVNVEGPSLLNYQAEPRLNDLNGAFSGLASTSMLRAYAGDPVRMHAMVAPGSEQAHVFTMGGLSWSVDQGIRDSQEVTSAGIMPLEGIDGWMVEGAGGRGRVIGDYFYGDMRKPFVQSGMWGIFRVLSNPACPIQPLPGLDCQGQPSTVLDRPEPQPTETPTPTPSESPSPAPDLKPTAEATANSTVISPNGDGRLDNLKVSATISEATDWKLEVLEGDAAKWSRSASSSTTVDEQWNGTFNGQAVPDGTYRWRLTGTDATGNALDEITGEVRVDTVAPAPVKLKAKPGRFDPAARKAIIKFQLAEPAEVSVKILRRGRIYRRWNMSADETLHKLRWNGKRGGRLVPRGKYNVKFKSIDSALNEYLARRGAVIRVRR